MIIGDITVIHENQRGHRLNLRPFSNQFKVALSSLIEMVDNSIVREVSKYMKILKRIKQEGKWL